jgi:hypothetical protein
MEELGIECLVGHPAQIRAAEPRKQKHDRHRRHCFSAASVVRRAGRKHARTAVASRIAATDPKAEKSSAARRTTYFACAPYEVGTYQAKQQSNGDEQHPITHDKTNNAVRSCAKSHPEGDLVRAIRYGKRHNPIDAKRCQE